MAIATFRAKANFSKGMRNVKIAHKLIDSESARHLRIACRHFETANRLNPEDPVTLHEWGLALYELAAVSEGKKAKELYKKASEKYRSAAIMDVENAGILNDWGATLLAQSRNASPDKAKELKQEALEKFQESGARKPGLASYNLACIYGTQGDLEQCQKYLAEARDKGFLPPKAHLENDPDLASVHDQKWFNTLLSEMPEV
jgi:tetratricopeptide (TPR) repeat protein